MDKYPKYLYRKGEVRLLKDEAEEEALEGTWYESPADVPADVPQEAAPAAAEEIDLESLSIPQLREKLAAIGVELPAGYVKKADLIAMHQEAAATPNE